MNNRIQSVTAPLAFIVTNTTTWAVWVTNIDMVARLVLTALGFIASIYTLFYYRAALKGLRSQRKKSARTRKND